MWFLVRVAFWLSIVILLLPAAPAPQTAAEPKFNATQALAAAMAAISDMREFCARQPDACTVGSQAIVAFGQKTQAGANIIYELMSKQANGERQKVGGEKTHRSTQKSSQDTLTVLDRAEPWAGPQPVARSGTAKALGGW
jgi:Family of unknown function (DUF5330)